MPCPAKSYGAVLGLRMLVGVAQAFVQGLGIYASLWYLRTEVAFRGGEFVSIDVNVISRSLLFLLQLCITPRPHFPAPSAD